jgi:hypothetical protein
MHERHLSTSIQTALLPDKELGPVEGRDPRFAREEQVLAYGCNVKVVGLDGYGFKF